MEGKRTLPLDDQACLGYALRCSSLRRPRVCTNNLRAEQWRVYFAMSCGQAVARIAADNQLILGRAVNQNQPVSSHAIVVPRNALKERPHNSNY